MKDNLIAYLQQYGDFGFEELPFGAVDALILAQFSYLKFDGMIEEIGPDAKAAVLKDLKQNEQAEQLFSDPRWEEENRAMFEGMCAGKRFGDIRLMHYINRVDTENEIQFSALTCILPDGSIKILYRGTDETIIGWKEDFNMAFLFPVPGQQFASEYLNMVAGFLPEGSITLTGHSKGGNLAVYAAMNTSGKVRERIQKIYNMDGPGFRTEIFQMDIFEQIESRIVKLIPESSIIGMVLENHGKYQVVKSKYTGFWQHDPFSWIIAGTDFVYAERIHEGRRIMDEAMNEWIMSLSPEEVEAFVTTLYDIVSASQAEDLNSLVRNWTKSIGRIVEAIQKLDKETVDRMLAVLKGLLTASQLRFKEETSSYFRSKMMENEEKITQKIEALAVQLRSKTEAEEEKKLE